MADNEYPTLNQALRMSVPGTPPISLPIDNTASFDGFNASKDAMMNNYYSSQAMLERTHDIGSSIAGGFGGYYSMMARGGRTAYDKMRNVFSPQSLPGYYSTSFASDVSRLMFNVNAPEGYSTPEFRQMLSSDLLERSLGIATRGAVTAGAWAAYGGSMRTAGAILGSPITAALHAGRGLPLIGGGLESASGWMAKYSGVRGFARPAGLFDMGLKLPGAIVNPLELYAAAQFSQAGEVIGSAFSTSNFLRSQNANIPMALTGGMTQGFGLSERLEMGQLPMQQARNLNITTGQAQNIMQIGMQSGVLYGTNPQQIKERFNKLTQDAVEIAKTLRISIENATAALGQVLPMGGTASTVMKMGNLSAYSGIPLSQMFAYGAQGAGVAQQLGMAPQWGAQISQNIAANMRVGFMGGTLNKESVIMAGGLQQATQQMIESNMRFYASPAGTLMAANMYQPGGGININNMLNNLQGGAMGLMGGGTSIMQNPADFLLKKNKLLANIPPELSNILAANFALQSVKSMGMAPNMAPFVLKELGVVQTPEQGQLFLETALSSAKQISSGAAAVTQFKREIMSEQFAFHPWLQARQVGREMLGPGSTMGSAMVRWGEGRAESFADWRLYRRGVAPFIPQIIGISDTMTAEQKSEIWGRIMPQMEKWTEPSKREMMRKMADDPSIMTFQQAKDEIREDEIGYKRQDRLNRIDRASVDKGKEVSFKEMSEKEQFLFKHFSQATAGGPGEEYLRGSKNRLLVEKFLGQDGLITNAVKKQGSFADIGKEVNKLIDQAAEEGLDFKSTAIRSEMYTVASKLEKDTGGTIVATGVLDKMITYQGATGKLGGNISNEIKKRRNRINALEKELSKQTKIFSEAGIDITSVKDINMSDVRQKLGDFYTGGMPILEKKLGEYVSLVQETAVLEEKVGGDAPNKWGTFSKHVKKGFGAVTGYAEVQTQEAMKTMAEMLIELMKNSEDGASLPVSIVPSQIIPVNVMSMPGEGI